MYRERKVKRKTQIRIKKNSELWIYYADLEQQSTVLRNELLVVRAPLLLILYTYCGYIQAQNVIGSYTVHEDWLSHCHFTLFPRVCSQLHMQLTQYEDLMLSIQ